MSSVSIDLPPSRTPQIIAKQIPRHQGGTLKPATQMSDRRQDSGSRLLAGPHRSNADQTAMARGARSWMSHCPGDGVRPSGIVTDAEARAGSSVLRSKMGLTGAWCSSPRCRRSHCCRAGARCVGVGRIRVVSRGRFGRVPPQFRRRRDVQRFVPGPRLPHHRDVHCVPHCGGGWLVDRHCSAWSSMR
jgi:hypothetical protein